MKKLFLLSMVTLFLFSTAAFSQNKTWTGAVSTAWNTAGNWNPSGVPNSTHNVFIPSAPANQPVISGTTTPVCSNLTVYSGALLTISGTSSANAQLTVAGTATFNGDLSIGGVLTRTGKLIANNVVWNSTSSLTALFGSRMEVSGNWTFASGSGVDMGFCFLTFNGSGTSNIYNYSAGSVFNSITVAKTGSGYVQVNPASNAGFTAKSNLNIQSGGFYGLADIVYYLRGNLLNSGSFVFAGNVRMEKTSGTQQVQPTTGSSFSNLTIAADPSTTVSVEGNLTLNGNLTIQSGTLNPNENTLTVFGNWNNTAGPDNFIEGTTSGRVIFTAQINKGEKSTHNYCNYTEHFNILEVNNQAGGFFTVNNASAAVSCNSYDHTHGGVNVQAGSFTINDLADNALMGYWGLQSGGEINVTQQDGYVDLNGATINITGGDFTVYGGNDNSYWSFQNNSTLTMSGGLFYFAETGIRINTSPALIHNITGGTIRTAHSFICFESNFNPSGGIFEMTGTSDAVLDMWPGSSLHFLRIDKTDDKAAGAKTIRIDRKTGLPLDDFGNRSQNVSLLKSLDVAEIAIDEGMLDVGNEKTVTLTGNLTINHGGGFQMGAASQLRIAGEMAVNVNSGGIFRAIGSETNNALITRYGSFYYYFNVQSGATIAARHAWFQYMANIIVGTDATVDPNFPFDYCSFSHGQGTFLVLNTTQELTIREANFPTLPPTNNVAKVTDAGRITFKDATGAYSGPAYEHDPHNRIDWTETQPGLWTGAVSTEWWNSGNWDGGIAPTAAINVVIPETAPNWPVLDVGDWECNDLTIYGTLTFGSAYLTAYGNMEVNGTIESYAGLGQLTVYGDVDWNPGAEDVDAGFFILVRGNWNFNEGSDVYVNVRVYFEGDQNKWIRNYSETSKIHSIYVNKTGGAQIGFSDFSTHPLVIENDLKVFSDAKFVSDSYQDVILKGDLISDGITQFNGAALKLEGASQSLFTTGDDYFNHLVFQHSDTVVLHTVGTDTFIINGDVWINSGVVDAFGTEIHVKSHWHNNAGPQSFLNNFGRVIFNGGNYHQYCFTNATFNVIEIDKPLGGALRISENKAVTCNRYDWTAGALDVLTNATFTAGDLADDGIYGSYYVNTGSTLNLYQDIEQSVDLNGHLTFNNGGTINIYHDNGGIGDSFWAAGADASITMNGGTLDFHESGIYIAPAKNNLNLDITGGEIKTVRSFYCARPDFNLTGGTIALYGNQNANLTMTAGTLYNLSINKPVENNVSLTSNATLAGGLTVNSGTLNMNGKTLATGTENAVNNGGTLHLNAGSALLISGTWWTKINEGGLIKVIGEAGNPAMISRNGAFDYIYLNVQNGGTISARNAWFHYTNPVIISPGGIIDPDNPFDDCQFRYAADGLLWVENQQTLLIRNAEFLTPAAGYNVRKSENNGELTFKDATGNYAGEAFENDPYNRIHWTVTQPGLWTGAVSTDWHTAGNWDDGIVPTSTVDVTIPVSAPHMPVISTHANCKNLTLNGTLTINDPTLTVSGNAIIAGHLTLNFELARFVVMGDLTWQSGSTASQNHIYTEIQVYGNFTFEAGSNVQLNNGGVRFSGASNKSIINHSVNSWFYNLVSHKTSGATIDFSDASSEPLRVTGTLSTETDAKFSSSSGLKIELTQNLVSYGTFELDWPRLVFSGADQYIQPNVNDYFYNIDFNQSGTVTINTSNSDVLNIRGGVSILSGVFNAGSSTLKVQSGWLNEVGPSGFIAGNSRVIFEGFLISDIYNNENFNILEINKSAGNVMANGVTVTCNSFDWTNGQLRVANGGVFTAYDLADDGIFADIELQSGSTVNLYQDIYQRVDLGGKLWIMGGSTVNVFGGNGWSQWPYGANATLYMTDGALDFKDQGINVNFMSPNSLTLDLSGGVIRTPVGFFCNRPDFDPEPSTLEIYGASNSSIDMQSGRLWDININKSEADDEVLINSDLTANSVVVNSGVLKSTPNSNLIFLESYVYGNGTIWLTEGTDIKLKATQEFAANGGKFMFMGEPDNYVSVGRHGTNHINLYVGNGGIVSARYAHFSHLLNGLFVMNTGIVDVDNAFTGCTFENGYHTLLAIHNNQDLTIHDAHFPNASAPYNVQKIFDYGSITFINAIGAFAGEAFEDDPHNRIHWVTPVPGLWTGAVSTDWFTAGNWSDGNVPTDDINVEIPADRMFMPVISGAQAFCHNLEVFGTLTINNNSLQVGGNADFHGTLAMNDWQAFLTVHENMNWHSGSAANITANANIRVYGNWSFLEGSQAQIENGAVLFAGTTPSIILCNSNESWFNHVEIEKSAMNYTYLDESSLFPLRTNNLYVFATAGFASDGERDIIVRGNVGSYGVMTMEGGSLILTGTNPIIAQNTGDYFHNLLFNQSGTATINTVNTDVLNVVNDIVIMSGVFEAGSSTIRLGGDWDNQAGAAAFDKGTSRVVFNGSDTQFCSSENFHILEVDNSVDLLYNQAYSTITCDIYDWTNGGLWISPGNFSAAALADDGLFGTFAIFGGTMELHQDVSKSVDLIGEIIVGYNAALKVHGGNGMSNWGESGDASVIMGHSTGVLDFKNSGINIVDQAPFQFTGNITEGTIRANGSFITSSPGFNPTGGVVELYGPGNSVISASNGSAFFNVTIDKPADFSTRVQAWDAVIMNNLDVAQGLLEVIFGKELEVWSNLEVQNGGWLALNSSTLNMKYLASVSVFENAIFSTNGYEGAMSHIKGATPADIYTFSILDGAILEAEYTIFENLPQQGVYIAPGAIVNPFYSFTNCEFVNGSAGASAMLTIDNDQDVTIENAMFHANTWGGQHNVRKNVNTGSVTFVNATGDFAGSGFEDDPYDRIFWGDEFMTQPISISAGWSGISSYILPLQPAMEDVFAPISDELIIAQTMIGMYYPGENTNTIGNWISHSAYKVKTNAACILNVEGELETNLAVQLSSGWNMLPVVTPDGADPADLFMPVNGFVIAKDIAGTGVYWPQYNINSIGYILPGKAYYVLMTTAGVVDYTGLKSTQNLTGLDETLTGFETLSGLGYNIQPTPTTHTIAILPEALKSFESGSIVAAFDQAGNCFGATVYSSEFISLTVFGDDPTSSEKDGFNEGEMIYFKTLTGFDPARAGLSGLIPTFDQTLPQSTGHFTENGLSAISGFEMATGIGDQGVFSQLSIYPNPSDGVVYLSGLEEEAVIAVTDVHGKVTNHAMTSSAGLVAITLNRNKPGIYFIKIEQSGQTTFRKLVLR